MSRSWIDENLDTQYTIFLLQGEIAIIFGLRSPTTPDTLRLNDFVAVAVKQRQCTPFGRMLLTSPIFFKCMAEGFAPVMEVELASSF